MRNPATLKKISDHLSVSISTVSRALKDHQDVSEETKRRVKELAEMLDYEPNSFAINLRKKHSDLFAIIVPEISSYFYHSFIEAVEEEARQQGFAIMILQSRNSPEIETANLRLCRINHVAGVFIAVNSTKENLAAYKKIEDWDIPMVFFDKVPSEGPFNKVCMADEQAGAIAAQKILEAGYSKIIAVLGSESMSITHRRLMGLRKYLSQNAPSLRLEVIFTENGEAVPGLLENMLAFLDNDTAIFSMSDEILCGVIKFLNQNGLQFPKDAGLLTISNGFFPGLFSPQINYVETNGSKLGSLAFSRMKEIMDGKKFIRENLLGCHYFEGGSLKTKD
jgi:LacI family transcriptional regulator